MSGLGSVFSYGIIRGVVNVLVIGVGLEIMQVSRLGSVFSYGIIRGAVNVSADLQAARSWSLQIAGE